MPNSKFVDYGSIDTFGDIDISEEDVIREAGKIATELMQTYRPVACLSILKISKKFLDTLISENVHPLAVDAFNEAADELADRASLTVVESKGEV